MKIFRYNIIFPHYEEFLNMSSVNNTTLLFYSKYFTLEINLSTQENLEKHFFLIRWTNTTTYLLSAI